MRIITQVIAALATFAALLVLAPAALADDGDGDHPGVPPVVPPPCGGPYGPSCGPLILPPPGGRAHGCNGNSIAMNPESPCAQNGIGCGPC